MFLLKNKLKYSFVLLSILLAISIKNSYGMRFNSKQNDRNHLTKNICLESYVNGSIEIRDLNTGNSRKLSYLKANDKNNIHYEFSENKEYIALWTNKIDGTSLIVFNIKNGFRKVFKKIKVKSFIVNCMFSPHNRYFVIKLNEINNDNKKVELLEIFNIEKENICAQTNCFEEGISDYIFNGEKDEYLSYVYNKKNACSIYVPNFENLFSKSYSKSIAGCKLVINKNKKFFVVKCKYDDPKFSEWKEEIFIYEIKKNEEKEYCFQELYHNWASSKLNDIKIIENKQNNKYAILFFENRTVDLYDLSDCGSIFQSLFSKNKFGDKKLKNEIKNIKYYNGFLVFIFDYENQKYEKYKNEVLVLDLNNNGKRLFHNWTEGDIKNYQIIKNRFLLLDFDNNMSLIEMATTNDILYNRKLYNNNVQNKKIINKSFFNNGRYLMVRYKEEHFQKWKEEVVIVDFDKENNNIVYQQWFDQDIIGCKFLNQGKHVVFGCADNFVYIIGIGADNKFKEISSYLVPGLTENNVFSSKSFQFTINEFGNNSLVFNINIFKEDPIDSMKGLSLPNNYYVVGTFYDWRSKAIAFANNVKSTIGEKRKREEDYGNESERADKKRKLN